MNGKKTKMIQPEMTVLDVISRFRNTEKIFKQWDGIAGECICCNSLFDSLKSVAVKYDLDLANFLSELETAVERG
jgi:hypothetical protein